MSITASVKALRHHCCMHSEKMLHIMDGSIKITVTTKLTSCDSEHKEKQVNKKTSNTSIIDAPRPNTPNSKKILNASFPSTLHEKQSVHQSVVA